MEVRSGFKFTEAGVLPQDWKVLNLSGVCSKITDGTHDTPKPTREGIPFLTAIHVKENRIDFKGCYYLPESVHKEIYKRCNPELNDVLMVNIGAGVATTALVNVDYEFSLKNVALLKPDNSQISGPYLNYYQSTVKSKTIESISSGGAQPFLSLGEIGQLLIAIPPKKAEQDAIADVLCDVDAYIESLEELITKKQLIKQGCMQELLTGKTRMHGNVTKWYKSSLQHVASISPGINKSISEMGQGTLYVTVQDLYDGTSIRVEKLGRIIVSQAEVEAKSLIPGDIVFGKSSVSRKGIGYPSQFLGSREAVVYTGFAYRVRAIKSIVNPTYLFYALRSKETRRWVIDNSQSSALTNMNQSIADAIPVRIPPIEEQKEIGEILSEMDREIALMQGKLAKAYQLKKGMMQELLNGRIRLV